MNTLVEIRNVSKVYERGTQRVVLHHVNLDIQKGAFLALMGPSGSGKTTLLNLIGGFQFYNLLPMLSAQKNVELPLLLTSLSASERKQNARIALELVGLGERAGHKPTELSGGQRQRVAIARAIVSGPDLLVCNEPTGDLDRQSATDILSLLQQLNRDHGKTIVMVTHDPKAAEYAGQTLHLDKGTLVESQQLVEA